MTLYNHENEARGKVVCMCRGLTPLWTQEVGINRTVRSLQTWSIYNRLSLMGVGKNGLLVASKSTFTWILESLPSFRTSLQPHTLPFY